MHSPVEKNAVSIFHFFFNLGELVGHPLTGNTWRSDLIKKKKDDGWGCNEVKCRRWSWFWIMFLFKMTFSRIGIQSSNNSPVSPSQESDLLCYEILGCVFYPGGGTVCSVLPFSHLPCPESKRAGLFVCAGLASFPEAIHFLMSSASHTKIAFN